MYVGRFDCGGLRQNKSLIVITSARNQPRFNSFKISFSINNKGVSKGESALFLNFEYLPKNNIPVVKCFMILIKQQKVVINSQYNLYIPIYAIYHNLCLYSFTHILKHKINMIGVSSNTSQQDNIHMRKIGLVINRD